MSQHPVQPCAGARFTLESIVAAVGARTVQMTQIRWFGTHLFRDK